MSTLTMVPCTLGYFPYPTIRRYQDEFINVVYNAVRLGEHVAVAAASGLGKTVGVLSATLPLAKEKELRILYIARTHKECDRAIEELKVINKCSTQVSGISIRGRSEACFNKLILRYAVDATTAMEMCGELKKRHLCQFFERLRSKRKGLEDDVRRTLRQPVLFSEVVELCKKLGICAYEFAKLVVGKVNVAAMSYNYLLHDEIRHTLLKNFEYPLSSYILIMDEAHNLPDVAVNMASEQLSSYTLRRAELEAKKSGLSGALRLVAAIRRTAEAVLDNNAQDEIALPASVLIEKIVEEYGASSLGIEKLLLELHEQGESIKRSLVEEGRLPRSSIHHVAAFFLRWLETSGKDCYLHLLSRRRHDDNAGEDSASYLEIVCLDPAQITSHVLSDVYSSISMSGTLEPIDCYIDVVGLPMGTKGYLFGSPFPKQNTKIVVCKGVTTSLSERSPLMYEKLSRRIAEAVNSTPTNTGVFAASYDVLHGLVEAGLETLLAKHLLVEASDSSSSRNDALVELFCKSAKSGGGVLLGVQGGRNSEGLDLPGDLLDTVVVVGVPYARPTPRVNACIEYYENKFPNRGKEYGYNIPAVRKAAQAAGRAFRSIDDRGAVVFLDRRFAYPPCVKLMPSWIRRSCKVLPDGDGIIFQELRRFYSMDTVSKT